MNANRLLSHFERVSGAPDAVDRLRRFILDLAVRGKLVEQDPGEGNASDLLRLAATAALPSRRHRRVVPSNKMAPPFQLPVSWMWVRVGEAFEYDAGIKREPKTLVEDRWLLELEDIEKDTSRLISRLTVKERGPQSTKSEFRIGDILYGKLRPYLNKVVVADQDGYSTTEIVAIRPRTEFSRRYCQIAFQRPDFVAYVERLGRGTKMPRLRTPDAVAALFPLPPLAEQHRIVEKVDELMKLCDKLEASQKERESRRDRLVVASLSRLSQPTDPDEFKKDARFQLSNLNRLSTKPEHIKEIRKAILNLAVRGKLVPQEAAWQTIPLSAVAEQIVDCPHSTPKWQPTGKVCVRTNQFTPGKLDLTHSRFVSETTYRERIQRLTPQANDILYSREGGILGVACRIPAGVELCLGQRMMLIRPGDKAVSEYLELVLNSPLITEIARKRTTGGAAPRVNVSTITAYPIPLPALAEQKRIVAKVEELMLICDQLETQLEYQQRGRRQLLEALLHEALEGVG